MDKEEEKLARRLSRAFVYLRDQLAGQVGFNVKKHFITEDYSGSVYAKLEEPKRTYKVVEKEVGGWRLKAAVDLHNCSMPLGLTEEKIEQLNTLPVGGERRCCDSKKLIIGNWNVCQIGVQDLEFFLGRVSFHQTWHILILQEFSRSRLDLPAESPQGHRFLRVTSKGSSSAWGSLCIKISAVLLGILGLGTVLDSWTLTGIFPSV